MHRVDTELQKLIETASEQGFLTFSQVNDYLPDEAINPEKLDHLLMSMEELGEAQGNVAIPAGMWVRLALNEAGISDLSPLGVLGPHDIQALTGRQKGPAGTGRCG